MRKNTVAVGEKSFLAGNWPGVASIALFVIAVPLPLLIAFGFEKGFEQFAQFQGPGTLWLIFIWVSAWTLLGLASASLGLLLSFRGFGRKWTSLAGLLLNGTFFFLQLRNL